MHYTSTPRFLVSLCLSGGSPLPPSTPPSSTRTFVVYLADKKNRSPSSTQVGLKVDHEWHSHMISKYQALLDRMATSEMPENAFYRVTMEKVIRYRLKAAMEHPNDPEKVEELCNCGQVEELIEQADDEMEVLEMYLRGRYWEKVKPVDIEYNPNPEDEHGDDIEWGDTPETMHADVSEKKM